eukprot:3646899-Amphidinium_carterae.1
MVRDGVDATQLHLANLQGFCQGLDGAIWTMPYPPNAGGSSSMVRAEIRKLVTDFVMSVAVYLLREGG